MKKETSKKSTKQTKEKVKKSATPKKAQEKQTIKVKEEMSSYLLKTEIPDYLKLNHPLLDQLMELQIKTKLISLFPKSYIVAVVFDDPSHKGQRKFDLLRMVSNANFNYMNTWGYEMLINELKESMGLKNPVVVDLYECAEEK